MDIYSWDKLVIERHYQVFEGIIQKNVVKYEFTRKQLEEEPIIYVKGREFPDLVISIQNITDQDISFFESFRQSDSCKEFEKYESHGVIILSTGDSHKTPTEYPAYNKSFWFETHLISSDDIN